MKKVKKVLAMVTVLSLAAMSLVGCTADEIELMDSLIKTSQIASYESTSTLEVNFSGESSEEELQEMFDEAAMYLDGLKLVSNEKALSDDEMTEAKMAADYELDMGDMVAKFSVWMDADFSDENSSMKFIFDVPDMLVDSFLDAEYAGKYIVMDYDNIFEEAGMSMDYSNLGGLGEEILEMVFDYIESSITDLDMGMEFAEKKGTEDTSRGESATKYEVKLDDASFKKFMEATINDVLLQERTVDFFKDYMELSMGFVDYEQFGEELGEELDQDAFTEELMNEMDEGMKMFVENLPEYREAVTQVFETIEDVQLLGEDGITSTYYVNDEGYVVEQKHAIDIELDIAEITELLFGLDTMGMESEIAEDLVMEEIYEEIDEDEDEDADVEVDVDADEDEDADADMDGKIKLGINYESSIYNINEEIDIEIPEVTEENSVDLFEELSSAFGAGFGEDIEPVEPTVEDGVNVLLNYEYIEFPDVVPQNIEGRVLVPIRIISEEMGADVEYEHETRTVTITDDDKTIVLNIGETTAYINDVEYELDVPADILDGRTMVPIRFVSEAMDAIVDWDGDSQTVVIFKF
ncbi:copper amine oxidase N-terminal domain-containing protein [Herbivorax sp. ANBcel31]|uniref:copper amine oxidase N-terminal domain-containing protein n=1 Tax=Herbivorax sp. ANBcel31 TaxID=3069754 RepID=UPI0027B06F35|nr:copper amine oxidase N-terminal domain-containing protein [Herbivorax sp. ANBcel31]MDQ2087118.1 copper amine oxidase N-terminal domain-containing protein [Herbivorax sp. ANBcel31]